MIVVYSKNNCSFCTQAKNLLNKHGVAFTEVRIDEDDEAREFIVQQGHRTVPQIYRDGAILVEGGYTGLAKQPETFFQTLKG
jgi:glutaredoxin